MKSMNLKFYERIQLLVQTLSVIRARGDSVLRGTHVVDFVAAPQNLLRGSDGMIVQNTNKAELLKMGRPLKENAGVGQANSQTHDKSAEGEQAGTLSLSHSCLICLLMYPRSRSPRQSREQATCFHAHQESWHRHPQEEDNCKERRCEWKWQRTVCCSSRHQCVRPDH